MNTNKLSNAGYLILLGIPFAIVGILIFAMSTIPTIHEYYTMQSWQPVQATVISAELKARYGENNSVAYKAKGSYSYEYLGKTYTGERIAISSGMDNIGSFQQERAAELDSALKAHSPILIYVNQKQPSESIFNRDIRLSLFIIKLACAILFILFGLGMIVQAYYNKKSKVPLSIGSTKNPLLIPDAPTTWASATQTENGKKEAVGSWVLGIFWCLICFTLTFSFFPKFKDNHILGILLFLVFNGLGVWLIFKAIYVTISWRKFGDVSLSLAPFPGEVGGQVAGVIDAPLLAGGAVLFTVELCCFHSKVSGSAKHSNTFTTTLWQANIQSTGNLQKYNNRIFINFSFNVPSGLPDAQPCSNDYCYWRIKISAPLPGVDFDRNWEIPVFAKTSL